MAKQITAVVVFLLLVGVACLAWLGINNTTPVLSNWSEFPPDVESRQYALIGIQWDDSTQGYILHLNGQVTEDVTIAVSDAEEASVYLWGDMVDGWGAEQAYQRVHSVRVPASVINEKHGLELLIRSEVWGSSSKELLNRSTITPVKLVLSGSRIAERVSTVAFGVSMLFVGLHALLICVSLVLYTKKRSEKYLLLLAVVATVSLAATLLSSNILIIPIQSGVYNNILQPFIAICPVILYAAMSPLLYRDCAPKPLQRFLTVPWLIVITAAFVTLRMFSSYSFYITLRCLLSIPVVWTLSKACALKQPGAWLMLVSHALSESVVVLLFLINNIRIAVPSLILTYIRINPFSYLFLLLASMFVICRRFAEKFHESELLGEKLTAVNAGLDRIVEARTRQLYEEQQKKHILMTNVFHDIRSPIFILQGNLEQLHPVDGEKPFKVAMQSKLEFMKRLTEDLFLISKLEDGAVLYEENRIDLSELIELQKELNHSASETEGVTVTFDCGEALFVWADKSRLLQAFQNLVDNALRYTPRGGSVAVKAFRVGDEAVLEVSDTGCGIPEKEQPLIFERYFRSSRADNPKSSGLGLHIAKEIVTHHRGTISVRSAPETGSCFQVRLPLLTDDE